MRISKKTLESATQRKMIVQLEKWDWMVNKVINCSNPGWPDLECYRNKIAVFIEVKREGETAKELQQYRHKQLREQGFEVISEATSLSDIVHLR